MSEKIKEKERKRSSIFLHCMDAYWIKEGHAEGGALEIPVSVFMRVGE